MKRTVALLTVCLILALATVALAAPGAKMTLREGKYIIGEDIMPGTYTITCIQTTGEDVSNMYGSLGGMMDSLGGTQGYGKLFSAFGGLMEEYIGVTVEIIGDYGDVLKTYTMQKDDTFTIKLKDKTALKITDGTCTLVAE